MSERFQQQSRWLKIILSILSQKPGGEKYTRLLKRVITLSQPGAAPNPVQFPTLLKYLIENGYAEKPSRGLYLITEKGRIMLKALGGENR